MRQTHLKVPPNYLIENIIFNTIYSRLIGGIVVIFIVDDIVLLAVRTQRSKGTFAERVLPKTYTGTCVAAMKYYNAAINSLSTKF